MVKSLSNDIRKRVVLAVDGGLSRRAAAKRFGVAPSSAIKWVDQWLRTGSFEAVARGGDMRSEPIERHASDILAQIDAVPDITLAELVVFLEEEHGLKVSQSMVWRLLDRHGMTYKKNRARQRTTTA